LKLRLLKILPLLLALTLTLIPTPITVAQQQVTLTYVVLSLRTLYGSEAADTTYELYIPLPKSVWSGCRDFEVYTSNWVNVPVWLFGCYDGNAGVPIHSPQLMVTTSTPPANWNTDPYFNDDAWARMYGGQGWNPDYNIAADSGTSTTWYFRYVVNLPLKPNSVILHVRVGSPDVGITTTFNACPGGNCLITVNGQPFGTAVSLYNSKASYDFDITNVAREGPNVITTIATYNGASLTPRFGIQVVAYYNNYWIARVFAKIPVQLTTTPNILYVFPRAGANVKDPKAFIFFDDFNTFDQSKYAVSGLTVSTSDGAVTLSTTSSGTITIVSISPRPPIAFIARINSNVLQSSAATYVRFRAGGTTVTEVVVNAGSTVPNTISGLTIYGGAWPWILGYRIPSSTTAFRVVGQRYSSVFTEISPLSTNTRTSVSISAYTPVLEITAGTSGYNVGVTVDWWALLSPPRDFRNPVYTASLNRVTLVSSRIVLPGSGVPATVLMFNFNTTIYGGDVYNSGLLTGQGLITISYQTIEDYNVTSFPSRSTLALQFKFTRPFVIALGYASPDGYFALLERIVYDDSTVQLLNQYGVPIAVIKDVQTPGYVQLEIFGSERRLYVYSQSGVKQATGASTLSTFNIIMHRFVVDVMVMESLLVTFTQNGLIAIKISGVDSLGHSIEMYVPDARSPTAVAIDIDAAPEVITIGVPIGVYPVKANITAYLDAQSIQYSLIIPDIEIPTVTVSIRSQQASGPIASLLANTLNKIGAMVGGEHKPLIATAVVLTLTFLATLTTAPLIAVIAAVALIAMAIAGWVNLPVALIAVFIVVAVVAARRYTR